MPTMLPNGRLSVFRVDLSTCSTSEFNHFKDLIEGAAEIVADAPGHILKVYWPYSEPITDLIDLPPSCTVRLWDGNN